METSRARDNHAEVAGSITGAARFFNLFGDLLSTPLKELCKLMGCCGGYLAATTGCC